jgi:biopolymer transport protein ExbB
MNALATVGSVAPFVGLLGTVLGIITAFQGIATTGSGGLASVSAGISEALIETAFGLAVAIPSVLGFNYLNGLVVREETMLNNAAGELIDLAESWAEHEIEALHAKQIAPRAAVAGNGKIERTAPAMEPA